MRTPRRHIPVATAILLSAGMVCACSKGARSADKPADAADPALAQADDPISVALRNLEQGLALDKDAPSEEEDPSESWTPAPRRADRDSSRATGPRVIEAPPEASTPRPTAAASEAPTTKATPTDQPSRAELATRLVEVVRQAMKEDDDPLRAALPLIGLGLVERGVSEPELRELLAPLTEPERQSVLAVRELLEEIVAGRLSATDPGALAGAMQRQRERLAAAGGAPFAPGTVALCTRVEAFGKFTPLSSARLVLGRPAAAVLYTEVRGFSQNAAGADGFVVELGQEVSLLTDDQRSVLQWRIPEQTVRSASRSRRSDFFLVQRLDFPRTLSAGAYVLKITVRDRGAAHGGAAPMFETTLPIEVVADPAVARDPGAPRPVRLASESAATP